MQGKYPQCQAISESVPVGNAPSTGCSNSSSHQKRTFTAGPGFNLLREFPSRDIHCCSDPLPYGRFPAELSIASLFCSTREFPSKVVYFISVPNQIVISMPHLFCLIGFSSFFPLWFFETVFLCNFWSLSWNKLLQTSLAFNSQRCACLFPECWD